MVKQVHSGRSVISCMGDSLTHTSQTFSAGNDGGSIGGMYPTDYYSYKLQQLLAGQNRDVLVRNFGIGGNTTAQMIARQAALVQYEVPDIAIIWGGTNDPNTTVTRTNLAALANYVKGKGCSKVLIVGNNLMNQTSGGETTAAPSSTYQAIRAAQAGAAADASVVFVDTFAYMAAKIADGTYADNSGVWMAANSGDVHINPLGQTLVAQAVYNTIVAQDWLKFLARA